VDTRFHTAVKKFIYLSEMNLKDTQTEGMTASLQEEEQATDITLLFSMADHPFRLLREGGKYGLKTVKKIFPTMLLFVLINIAFLGFAIYRLVITEVTLRNLSFLFLVLIAGVVVLAFVVYKMYRLVQTDIIRVIYEKATPLFQRLCVQLVIKAEEVYQKGKALQDTNIQNVIDIHGLLTEQYGRVPGILRKVVLFSLKRTPVFAIVDEFKVLIMEGDKAKVSELLYVKMDTFIREAIAKSLGSRWMYILLLLNILIQALIIIRIK
jgi:hypothetical protein